MKSVCVVSDLHMFCKRSHWEDHLPEIYAAAAGSDLFVFNGDTFDFKWTTLGSVEETVHQAIVFLRGLAAEFPDCRFHVNLGNHDHVQGFIDALSKLARETENLSWHPYYFRVGNTLFLHGDMATRKMSHQQLEAYRAGWLHHKKQGRVKNRVYDAAFRAGAHIAVSRLVHPPRRTLERVHAYIHDIGHGAPHGVETVYFGHTHVPVDGEYYGGVTFHNGGAPMRGMDFSLLRLQLPETA
ncbi:MAG: metallophosphoesterase [Candidatus Hydrogenedentes bacterium]|nr:metallophosphoesterase [Candidatus Hydrogenedentota bacterium]